MESDPRETPADNPQAVGMTPAPDLGQWLDAVLRETLATGDEGSQHMMLQGLLDVRRRHLNEPFQMTPAGEEMVAAVLSTHYGKQSWVSMPAAIMESLMSDPICRQRLEVLWDRLGQAVRGE